MYTTVMEGHPEYVKTILRVAAKNLNLLAQGKPADTDDLGYSTVYDLAALLNKMADEAEEQE